MWLVRSDKCPLCKHPIVSRDLFVVEEPPAGALSMPEPDASANAGATSGSSASQSQGQLQGLSDRYDKARNLEIILRRRTPASKFLIFASYENSFVHIVQVLERLGMSYSYLKGNHDVVRNIVERYRSGAVRVLLVNARNYGSGLNLENTTDIVMFHKFDSEIEKQVVGRANRMGRTGPLNVYYLLYENEMQRAAANIGGLAPARTPGAGQGL
jgi:SNF2 family DNA or RNA helicase